MILLLGFPFWGFSQHSLFEKRIFLSESGDSLPYRILFPEDYGPQQSYPLVLFMHGAGERGIDNEKQLTHGSQLFLDSLNRKQYPAIVVFPQCPVDGYWIDINIRKKLYAKEDLDFKEVYGEPSKQLRWVMELVTEISETENVDKQRRYVMGLSMGSFGTFELLARWPGVFSAAVAICGGGNVAVTDRYFDQTAVWITHGDKDDIVAVQFSKRVYEALKAKGGDVRYTEFAGVNHNAWDATFATPDLLEWLFSKSK